MTTIEVKGPIIRNGDKWIYEWFGADATCPNDVIQALPSDGSEVQVIINSGGGYVNCGNEIYTALKSYGGMVSVIIIEACSAASVIAMAGNPVKMTPVGQIMMHNASGTASGDYHVMDKTSEFMQKVNQSIANAYQIKTGLSKEELLALMDKETWMTAEEAKEMGFIDEILFQDEKTELFTASSRELLPENVIQKMQFLKMTDTFDEKHNTSWMTLEKMQEVAEEAVNRVLEAKQKARISEYQKSETQKQKGSEAYSRFFF